MQLTKDSLALRLSGVSHHGRYIRAHCPFPEHSDSKPSLLVYDDGAYCMGCQRRASLYEVEQAITGTIPVGLGKNQPRFPWHEYRNLEELIEEAHNLLITNPSQRIYLKSRGVESCVIPQRLGWMWGWYTVPVYDQHQKLLGAVLRAGVETEKAVSDRFLFPPRQAPLLYVPDWDMVLKSKAVAVVFGIFDALVLVSLGIPAVSPTRGQNFDPIWFQQFRKRLVVIPDRGEELQGRRLLSTLGWRGSLCRLEFPDDSWKDPADFATHKKQTLLRKQLQPYFS